MGLGKTDVMARLMFPWSLEAKYKFRFLSLGISVPLTKQAWVHDSLRTKRRYTTVGNISLFVATTTNHH